MVEKAARTTAVAATVAPADATRCVLDDATRSLVLLIIPTVSISFLSSPLTDLPTPGCHTICSGLGGAAAVAAAAGDGPH